MANQEQRFRIGRDPACEVSIADESVSRVHAVLSLLNGNRLFLADNQSTNGTRIVRKGETIRVSQEFLQPDDRIQFGKIIMAVEEIWRMLSVHHSLPPFAALSTRADESKPAPAPPSHDRRGRKMIRCECGVIKPEGSLCPLCKT